MMMRCYCLWVKDEGYSDCVPLLCNGFVSFNLPIFYCVVWMGLHQQMLWFFSQSVFLIERCQKYEETSSPLRQVKYSLM